MIDGSEKRNGQLAFELQNSYVCEKRSKVSYKKDESANIYFLIITLSFILSGKFKLRWPCCLFGTRI